MSFGRFRRDPCGTLAPPARCCPRCFRHYQRPEVERELVHRCPACLEYQRALPAGEERASRAASATTPAFREVLLSIARGAR